MTTKLKHLSSKFSKTKVDEPSAVAQTERDFKNSVLMVSIFVNMFMLCLWIAVQTTSQYDAALVEFFVSR